MRYRYDVPRGTDLIEAARHVVEHLAGAVHPHDDPGEARDEVQVEICDHVDGDATLVSIIGTLPGNPAAHYLQPDYDPAADHPGIVFRPFEEPEFGHFADPSALARFREDE